MSNLTPHGHLVPHTTSTPGSPRTVQSVFIVVVACFCVLGLFMVPSSSTTAWPTLRHQELFVRHVLHLGFGWLIAYACSRVPLRTWRRIAPALYLVSLVALTALLIPAVSVEVNGARRWLRLGPLSVQVSEVARVATVLVTAYLAGEVATAKPWRIPDLVRLSLPTVLATGMIIVEPDFGGAALVLVTGLIILFLAGLPWRFTLVAGLAGGILAVAALVAEPYRLVRVQEFVQTWKSVDHAPYQVRQSLLSFVSGGIWGTGLGAGWQKLGFLPESHTDYVLAVIGEELGLVGVFVLIAGWGVFVLCVWGLACQQRNSFANLAILGLGTNLAIQAIIHMGVVLALLPPKGIGLPFVSYGGSNLTVSLASVGIILALSRPGSGAPETRGTEVAAEST